MTLPLLLLPGTLCTARLFKHPLQHLRETTTLHVADLSVASSVQAAAAQVLEAAPARFALAGFSLGAIVAFEILRQASARVSALALISANPHPARPEQRNVWRDYRTWAAAGDLARVANSFAGGLYRAHPQHAEHQETVQTMAAEAGDGVLEQQLTLLETRPDSLPTLETITQETLLIYGQHDPVTPPALGEEMRTRLPHASLVTLGDCGHYVPLEQPLAFSALLSYWLQVTHA